MLTKLNQWLEDIFANSDVNKLILVIAGFCTILWFLLDELAPLLAAIMLAYILDGGVNKLHQWLRCRRSTAVMLMVMLTLFLSIIALYALPRFLLELRQLGTQLPELENTLANATVKINSYLPEYAAMDSTVLASKSGEIFSAIAAYLFNNLFSYAGNLFSLFIYLILLPLLVFFLLRDKLQIVNYLSRFIPTSPIFSEFWQQANEQFGSYIRGKFLEAAIVGATTWIFLLFFETRYALSLAILVGLSVFVPFVGAVAVTFPIVLFAYLQFGWSSEFFWIVGLYSLVQLIDGQILVPLLFSEVIKIHPVALFSALIFFGNLWGIWGVFFAIPLASVIKIIVAIISKRHQPVAAT
ncbi:MAG: AI-2E family transporter [Proteobacteria bacterium]|nr:AI-2E family transporter [Pseudomonadota bacterium]MCH9757924.1 AI-2E family transporter [Pseudomonadota bacterium]